MMWVSRQEIRTRDPQHGRPVPYQLAKLLVTEPTLVRSQHLH